MNKREIRIGVVYQITTAIMGIFLGILIMLIVTDVRDKSSFALDSSDDEINELITLCSQRDLQSTTRCMVKYVRGIYIYNETDDNWMLTLKQLKERGGDCLSYSRFYSSLGRKLNFSTKIQSFPYNKTDGHAYALIWNGDREGSWCVLNQGSYHCFN